MTVVDIFRIRPYSPYVSLILIIETFVDWIKIIFFFEKTQRVLKEMGNMLGKLLEVGEKIYFVNE